MGLYYNPPSPHIGAAQPLEPKKLTPPNGPTADNPPFNGGARALQEILNSWFVPAPLLELRKLRPPSQQTADNPPFNGGARVRQEILNSWSAPSWGLEQRKLSPPAPTDNPPFNGGARVRQEILNSWFAPSWGIEPKRFNPPSQTPDNPPFNGGARSRQEILNSWFIPSVGLELRKFQPVSGPTPDSPPLNGGARSRQEILNSWFSPAAAIDLRRPFVPAQPAQVAVPPSLVPDAIYQSWNVAVLAAQTGRKLTPPISGPTPDNPPLNGGARARQEILNSWFIPVAGNAFIVRVFTIPAAGGSSPTYPQLERGIRGTIRGVAMGVYR